MTSNERMTERTIQRRLFWNYRSSTAIMPNYTPHGWFECDLFVVTKHMYSMEYEIKLTRADYQADFRKRRKHSRLKDRTGWLPTRFFYVMPEGLIDVTDIPDYAGLIYLMKPGWFQTIREAPRLSSEKHDRPVVTQMWRAAGYRYWNERFKLEDMADQQAEASR